MSVLIKGMEIPECCIECAFHKKETTIESVENGGDTVTYKQIVRCEICGAEDPYMSYRDADTKRRDDCPIIEIPPHGDLIDGTKLLNDVADVVENKLKQGDISAEDIWTIIMGAFNYAPTVIESEGEE